jgi:glycosyltransferase involved in cell wall biosynthesis
MRVAYVCADIGVPVFGSKGCSIHVQEIVRTFLKRGDQVELFAARLGGDLPEEFRQCGIHAFPPEATKDPANREIAAQKVAMRIHAAMETKGPFDVVYERYSLWSQAGPRFAQENNLPSILEINAPLIREQHQHRALVNKALALTTSQLAFSQASSLATVSQEVAKSITEDFHIDPRKLHVIPNGVDIERFSPNVAPCLPSKKFTVGFVGSLKPWHGVETLLQAFSLLQSERPDSRLLIIGDGPMRKELQETYCPPESTMSRSVCWTGCINPSEIPAYLTSLDVAVAPYPKLADFYFSPLKVYEYMACGLPTVASDIGQLKSMITHGVDGFLYEPCGIAELARTLSFLAEQTAVRNDVGRRARARAVAEFSWNRVLSQSIDSLAPKYNVTGAASSWESRGGLCS